MDELAGFFVSLIPDKAPADVLIDIIGLSVMDGLKEPIIDFHGRGEGSFLSAQARPVWGVHPVEAWDQSFLRHSR